jgi:hypothetical protein
VKFLEEMILVIVFFEHLCFVVLGVTGTEGQETERFLGARKPARLLVGREDSVVSLWASGKRILGSAQDYITTDELLQTKEEVFFSDILLLIFWVYLCFKFLNLKVSLLLISSCY